MEEQMVVDQEWSEPDWDRFVTRHWERSPAKLPVPSWARFCGLEELFEIIVASRGAERLPSDRFWVANKPAPARKEDFSLISLDLLGPQPSDRDLDGFFERMGGRSYGINLHRLEKSGGSLKACLDKPMGRLQNVSGVGPVKRWDLDCFFGTYRMTPFGIHRDRASVFSFCLKGERTYLTWPPDYSWPQDDLFVPDPSRLEKHLDAAERFRIRAGELFYWPSNRWHVVCSDGRPSAVVQLSAYFGSNGL